MSNNWCEKIEEFLCLKTNLKFRQISLKWRSWRQADKNWKIKFCNLKADIQQAFIFYFLPGSFWFNDKKIEVIVNNIKLSINMKQLE